MDLRENIRRLRKAKGLTQVALAKAAKLSSVKMIEKRGSASMASLEAIAKALGCEVSDLVANNKSTVRRKAS